MVWIALAFLGGCVALQFLAELPPRAWCYLLPALPTAWYFRTRTWRVAAACAGGFLWALWQAWGYQSLVLPAHFEQRNSVIEGQIASIPETRPFGTRFIFETTRLNATVLDPPRRYRLTWRATPALLMAGARWQFAVRLKQPHGFFNPGGFDYEAWLYQHDVHATGYVKSGRALAPGPDGQRLTALRQDLGQAIAAALDGTPFQGLIVALVIGEQRGISDAQWEVFNRTGTTHLVAISGLHITLVAGLVLLAVRRLWALWPRAALAWPAPKAGAAAALLAAIFYAALAGFSVPAQRAVIMVAVAMGALMAGRTACAPGTLAWALLAVLWVDTSAVLAPGFWLSYLAVAVLLYAAGGQEAGDSLWRRWGHAQWAIAVGLLPLTLLWFQRSSLIGPVANLIAVPWMDILVVPAALAGSLVLPWWDSLGRALLALAELLMQGLWPILKRLAALPLAQWEQYRPLPWALAAGLIGAAWLLAPRGFPARWLGIVLLLPVVYARPAPLIPGALRFTLLDVGQGLAAIIETAHHTLLYDSGPRLGASFDSGEAVVLPALRELGVRRVDRLIVSHDDSDHTGGVASLRAGIAIGAVVTADPATLPGSQPCRAGQTWRWDGVDFAFLHPAAGRRYSDNNGSCVLRVGAPGAVLLLTGDIERGAEHELVARAAPRLAADILVVPHHGSKSSSSPAFVAATRPRYALFPLGYLNRYGYPKPEVVARYRRAGAETFDTAGCGAIQVEITPGRNKPTPLCTRRTLRRYWHDAD